MSIPFEIFTSVETSNSKRISKKVARSWKEKNATCLLLDKELEEFECLNFSRPKFK
jgi:hypothetical protein